MRARRLLHAALLAGVWAGAWLAWPAAPAEARRVEVCESDKGRYRYCSTDTRGGVRLGRQLSDSPCRFGDSWGYDGGGIWVNRGCRAEFLVGTDHGPPGGGGGGHLVTCESDNMRHQYCPARTGGGVRLQRQLSGSPCQYGHTWGYDGGGVWVNRGCRAEFLVGGGGGGGKFGGGGWYGSGPGAGGWVPPPEPPPAAFMTCASEDQRYRFCPVPIPSGARLQRQLSGAGCWLGSTWGFEPNGIWVTQGCRGEFAIW
jgi:hypothetical protein